MEASAEKVKVPALFSTFGPVQYRYRVPVPPRVAVPLLVMVRPPDICRQLFEPVSMARVPETETEVVPASVMVPQLFQARVPVMDRVPVPPMEPPDRALPVPDTVAVAPAATLTAAPGMAARPV